MFRYVTSKSGMLFMMFSLLASSITASAQRIDSMFFVTKKQNRNQVHYAANSINCRWIGTRPVHAYWRMLERGPDVRQELDPGREQDYFDYSVVSRDDRVLSIKLGAFDHTPALAGLIIRIVLSGEGAACRSDQTIDVGGAKLTLSHMHVDYSLIPPRLNFVEFHGTDATGRAVMKRVDTR